MSKIHRDTEKAMVPLLERDRNSGLEMVQCATLPRPDQLSWYALRIQSRLGSLASTTLRDKGYEEFFPLYWSRRRWFTDYSTVWITEEGRADFGKGSFGGGSRGPVGGFSGWSLE